MRTFLPFPEVGSLFRGDKPMEVKLLKQKFRLSAESSFVKILKYSPKKVHGMEIIDSIG